VEVKTPAASAWRSQAVIFEVRGVPSRDLFFCNAASKIAICNGTKRIYNGIGFIDISVEKEVIQ
jgi:hypothetical protein